MISENNGELESSYRTLTLTIRDSHFFQPNVRVKCIANIGEAYWRSTETVIQLVGQSGYMLESRSNSDLGRGITHIWTFGIQ